MSTDRNGEVEGGPAERGSSIKRNCREDRGCRYRTIGNNIAFMYFLRPKCCYAPKIMHFEHLGRNTIIGSHNMRYLQTHLYFLGLCTMHIFSTWLLNLTIAHSVQEEKPRGRVFSFDFKVLMP